MLHATGSQAHLDALAALAEKKAVLDQRGLHRGRKIIARKSESDIYEALGLPFIEPELREGADEIALALPISLVLGPRVIFRRNSVCV